MFDQQLKLQFQSVLCDLIEQFIQEKHNCGYRYRSQVYHLRDLDRFLVEEDWGKEELPKDIVCRWGTKRSHESPSTLYNRRNTIRQFSIFLVRMGIKAHVLETVAVARKKSYSDFKARIFTREELRKMFTVVDEMPPNNWSPLRHLIMPELFRLLYVCGLRIGEAVRLRVRDVDLIEGILTIMDGKFGKDRLVPLHPTMVRRLKRYASLAKLTNPDDYFFPAPDGGHYHTYRIYCIFREVLTEAGISHGGRGCGPRVHDFRHSFAVTRLIKWYREGQDLNAKLPMLSTYLGHREMSGTQVYLQLTADLFPDITAQLEERYAHILPEWRQEQ